MSCLIRNPSVRLARPSTRRLMRCLPRAGLCRRLEDVRMQASVAAGTEYDEYLERDAEHSRRLSEFETE